MKALIALTLAFTLTGCYSSKPVPKFVYQTKIAVTEGFYKGHKGIVETYVTNDSTCSSIEYKVQLETETHYYLIRWICEEHLEVK